jgi:putative transposase
MLSANPLGRYAPGVSRLRRLVLSDRYFFVTCNLLRTRTLLNDPDFEILARVIDARRRQHGFLVSAWVFLPDHWHAILGISYPRTVSLVLESIKVASTRRINAGQNASRRLWQGRFFDRALRTVREYNDTVEYIHRNPVRRGLVETPEAWKWSSAHEYAPPGGRPAFGIAPLRIDRARIPAEAKTRI